MKSKTEKPSLSAIRCTEFSFESICKYSARRKIEHKYCNLLEENNNLNRKLVSDRGNKGEITHGWISYREGFSFKLVELLIKKFGIKPNANILEPFSGSGTTLLVCKNLGINAVGFEILPICQLMWQAKDNLEKYDLEQLAKLFEQFKTVSPQQIQINFSHLNITNHAFSERTENDLIFFNQWFEQNAVSLEIKILCKLMLASILEKVSYTRKDGQYLRWDYRSQKIQQRNQSRIKRGKPPLKAFNKGDLPTVKEALINIFQVILDDLSAWDCGWSIPNRRRSNFSSLKSSVSTKSKQKLIEGSVLKLLPQYDSDYFDAVITSPPYCNRYDYTRTYALELAYLGIDELKIKQLRQEQLCCTVENKSKLNTLENIYRDINCLDRFEKIKTIITDNKTLKEINKALVVRNNRGEINNKGILNMVNGYFVELTFLFAEIFRTCKSGAYVAIVNDNVRYAGEIIPVDTLCTEIAESIGFIPEKIYVLPQRKGNSSQQMEKFGREALRKSITVWKKP